MMVTYDEDALICDFAETYGIYEYRSLPVILAATFACGLREDSRIKTKMSKIEMPLKDYLIAAIFDAVNWLCWTKTKDAGNGLGMPERILNILTEKESVSEGTYMAFSSPEEFEKVRSELLTKG